MSDFLCFLGGHFCQQKGEKKEKKSPYGPILLGRSVRLLNSGFFFFFFFFFLSFFFGGPKGILTQFSFKSHYSWQCQQGNPSMLTPLFPSLFFIHPPSSCISHQPLLLPLLGIQAHFHQHKFTATQVQISWQCSLILK